MKIINVVGARPNFMKIAPIIKEMNKYPEKIQHLLVHTGQHYDQRMSDAFFVDLGMPKPNIELGVGSGSHAEQTARIMVEFEKVCIAETPDLVIVVGDVNSTLACTITAKKLGIKVAHVEAGLRSRDMSMPEEINRLCTDVLCDYLFTTDHFANENLLSEGVAKEKIQFVGNVMIDTLLQHKQQAGRLDLITRWGLKKREFATLTLHRPSNVDDPVILESILKVLHEAAQSLPIIFPIHPRTKNRIKQYSLDYYLSNSKNPLGLWPTQPLGYLEFLHLNMNAFMVLTDSGGLQEETTALGVPCITLRNNTERPITCEIGSNFLAGNDPEKISYYISLLIQGRTLNNQIPEKWDGKAAERIIRYLLDNFC